MDHDMEQNMDDTEQRIREIEAEQDKLKSQLAERDEKVKGLESSNQELQARLDQALAKLQSETSARKAAEGKAREAAKVLEEKEAAVARVDQLTRQAAAQGDSYGVLGQTADLERELDERTKALAAYRGEKSQELMAALEKATVLEKKSEDEARKSGEAIRAADSLRTRLARMEASLKEVEERSAADKTALEKQISLQETLTTLQKDKADEAVKKITSLQV
ncbi:unnamed protein product, partial [Ectocarpus sp. 12 AP-2014]